MTHTYYPAVCESVSAEQVLGCPYCGGLDAAWPCGEAPQLTQAGQKESVLHRLLDRGFMWLLAENISVPYVELSLGQLMTVTSLEMTRARVSEAEVLSSVAQSSAFLW